jgi:hypothetical protein
MDPVTGINPLLRVKVDALMVAASIVLLKVAVITLYSATLMASSTGSVLITTGCTGASSVVIPRYNHQPVHILPGL